jgi:hypothetical protein
VVWALSAGYMASHLNRGWVPNDEGALAQSAVRVLRGEIPHRDFDELYTGGLTFLHAAAFRAFGINLASLRLPLFAAFLIWVPVIFYMAWRLFPLSAAAALTLLAVAWSVPNYPAAMPSWYNLFFGTFGCAALFRYIDVDRRRWLLLAGLCAGLSIVVKIVGLYFVAAVLLFFLFREQCLGNAENPESPERGSLYGRAIIAGVTLVSFAVLALTLEVPHDAPGAVYFAVPVFALAALLIVRERAGVHMGNKYRIALLLSMAIPFAIGMVIPIAVFLIPYILTGSIHSLIQGVFLAPTSRFGFAVMKPPALRSMSSALAVALLIVLLCRYRKPLPRALAGALAIASFGWILYASKTSWPLYRFAWHSLATAIPLIVLAGAVLLAFPRYSRELPPVRQQQLMLLLAAATLLSLVQMPFAEPIYFCYVAPLAVLAAAAVFAGFLKKPPRLVLGAAIVFYLLFAVWRVTPGFIYDAGFAYAPDIQTHRLDLPRAGGLRVDPRQARIYEELIPLVRSHADGTFLYAAPDCPEVYFLSGLRNPTRMLFDFLGSSDESSPATILSMLAADNINEVVINTRRGFSLPMQPALREALDRRFPHFARFGPFQVRWRQ